MTKYDLEGSRENRHKKIMQQWGSWIAYWAECGRGSWPRDAFEAIIDYYEEKLEKLEKND